MKHSSLLLALLLFTGCVQPGLMQQKSYQERPTIESSLFKSDRDIISEETVARLLSSKLVLPPKGKIALMKFGTEGEQLAVRYGYSYWRSEDFLKLQQEYIDTMSTKLLGLPRIIEVSPLPSLLTPKEPTVPILREAAVRLQADLLLIYRVTSDLYQETYVFSQDEAKAYSTCEVVLLDIRTGLIPFTTVATQDFFTKKEKEDINLDETVRRAERVASSKAVAVASDRVVAFLTSVP